MAEKVTVSREDWACDAIRSVLPGYDDPQSLPLDLNAVARHLGVADIRYLAREFHGFTHWGDRPTVYLALSRSDGRRRFTLAHELGHILLGADVTGADTDEVERLCDAIAGELLMPTSWLESWESLVTDLASARQLADRMRVSLATTVVRLRALGRQVMLFTLVRASDGQWIVASRIGAPARWQGRISLGIDTLAFLEAAEAWPGKDSAQFEFQACNWAGDRMTAKSTAMIRGNRVTVLAVGSPRIVGEQGWSHPDSA